MTGDGETPSSGLGRHLCWLAELPPGWHELYRSFAERLAAEHPDVEVTHAGAKLATLQVLTHGGGDAHRRLVREVTQASASTCELCGRLGRMLVDKSGWCRALCPEHSSGFAVQVAQRGEP